MQCVNTSLAITCYSPKLRLSNYRLSKRTHLQRNPEEEYYDRRNPGSVKSITSTSNPFVKHCLKLRQSSSYRHSHGLVPIVGSTPIREILRFQESLEVKTVTMECLILLDKAQVPEELDCFDVLIVLVSTAVMKRLSGLQSSESIEAIGLMRVPNCFLDLVDGQEAVHCGKWFPLARRILVLDGVQDPGNLGTLVRSAMAFRWSGVFLLPGCCDPFNEKAIRSSRGASFQLPIVRGSWAHLEALETEFRIKMVAGHPGNHDQPKRVLPLSQELADSLAHVPLCLILGSEGIGLSEKTRRECELVSIPMAGNFESLNVSVAGGIFLHALQPRDCALV